MSDLPKASVYKSELAFPFAMALMLAGCLVYYETGNFAAVSVASALASACCAYLALVLVKNLTINVLRIQAYLGAVAYFFPVSYIGIIGNHGLLQATNDELASSSILVVISISIGWCISFLIRFSATIPGRSTAFLDGNDIALLVIPACLFQILMIASGKWSYSTLHPDTFFQGDEPVSPLVIFAHVTFGIGPMLAYNYGLLRRSERTWALLVVTFGALALGTGFWLIDGRRSMATFVLLSAVAFLHGRTKGTLTPKQMLTAALVFLVLGFGILQASKFFYGMRLVTQSLGARHAASMPISEFLALSSRFQAEPISAETKWQQDARPFVIESVAILTRYVDHHLFGKELSMHVVTAIPAFLFPGKAAFTSEIGTQEDLWSKEFGFPLKDYANSYVLDGYVDFWYFGFTVYALVAGVIITIVFRFYSIHPALTYFCLFNGIAEILQIETAVPILFLRDMMALFIPLWIGYAILETKGSRTAKFTPRRWPPKPGPLSGPSPGQSVTS